MKRYMSLPIKLLITCTIFSFSFLFNPAFCQQKSIKVNKQTTHFFYANANLQAGWFGEKEDMNWMPTDRNPLNQLALSYKSKRRSLLQKGYTPFIYVSDVKAKFAFTYNNHMSHEGEYSAEASLAVKDIWIKLATKWDRTSLKIGNFSLPFGHNPKVDPDYSFIPNIGGTDLGLSRDFGILFKTPVSTNLDLELSLTSGGLLGQPFIRRQLTSIKESEDRTTYTPPDYNGEWLFTARLGNPAFNKTELGVFGIIGRLKDDSDPQGHQQVYRIGFDWIYKNKEDFKLTNQLLLGPTITSDISYFKMIQQSSIEIFMQSQLDNLRGK